MRNHCLPMSRMGALSRRLQELGSVAVCFSGGRDSSVLAAAAAKHLPDSHVAVFVDVPVLPRRQAEEIAEIAKGIGCRCVTICLGWEDVPGMCFNGPRRCYVCKRAIYEATWEVARGLGISHVVAGENVDDDVSGRPGRVAGDELGVEYPLIDVGFGREDVLALLGELGLGDLSENTCMATRYPCGEGLDEDCVEFASECERAILDMVEAPSLRVRIHGGGVVLEAHGEDLETINLKLPELETVLAKMGFSAVAVSERK